MNRNRSAELAARLNPSVQRFTVGIGGIPEYPQDIIGMALGMVKDETQRLWIRVIYAKHTKHEQELKRHILMQVVDMAAPERWQIEKPGTLGKLIELSIQDVSGNNICFRCNGQKYIILTKEMADMVNEKANPGDSLLKSGQSVVCPNCEGVGYKSRDHKHYANAAGIHHELWKRHWRARYGRILDIVRGVDYDAKRSFAVVLA